MHSFLSNMISHTTAYKLGLCVFNYIKVQKIDVYLTEQAWIVRKPSNTATILQTEYFPRRFSAASIPL
jgi:hypothetical protein